MDGTLSWCDRCFCQIKPQTCLNFRRWFRFFSKNVEDDFVKLENFVCRAYDQNHRLNTYDINSLRYLLFNVSTENNLRKLPPTRDALRLHILRSAFVAGCIWGQCLQGHDAIPDPTDWGYILDINDMPIPEWCPPPSILLKNVIYSCSCKNKCTRCKCVKDLGSCLPHCKCLCKWDRQLIILLSLF